MGRIKFIHTADWHFYNGHKYSVKGSRLEQIISNANYIVDFAIRNRVDFVCVAGDITENYNTDSKTLGKLSEIIKKACSNGIKFRVLIGNHDTDGEEHSLKSFENLTNDFDHNLKVIDKEIYVEKINGIKVTYVPWTIDLIQNIIDCKKGGVMFTHGGVNMAYVSSGKRLKSNLKWEYMKGFSYVGLGDYHKYQNVGDPKFNIYYSGSIARFRWDERDDEKGFNIVIANNKKSKVKKIILNDVEMIEIRVKSKNLSEYSKKMKTWNGKKLKNSIIKLFVYGDIGDGVCLMEFKNMLYSCGVSQIYDKIISNFSSISVGDEKIDLSLSPRDVINRHCNANKLKEVYREYIVTKLDNEL